MRFLKKAFLLILAISAGVSCLAISGCSRAEDAEGAGLLDIYYVRHAETVANATGSYTKENERKFSQKGKDQLPVLTEELKEYDFDVIISSPLLRARHTVLPYLKETDQQAVIWPEVAECCWQSDRQAPPSGKKGAKIEIEEENKKYFIFRDKKATYLEPTVTYQDGIEAIKKAVKLIKEKYAGEDMDILIVSHSLAGSRLIELLQGKPPLGTYSPDNAAIVHLKEQPEGTFNVLEGAETLR